MRRIYTGLTSGGFALVAISSLLLVGCGSSSSDTDPTVKPGTGKVIQSGPPTGAQAAYASQMEKQGQIMNQSMQQSAAAMAAAKARTGGK